MKSHGDEVTDFYDKGTSMVDSSHTGLVVISLDSALKKSENYHTQLFFKGCKYIEKKVINHINYNLSDFLLRKSLKSQMKNRLKLSA